ncbi:MAG: hypothetical protein QW593_03115 [Candidatus Nitrosocaldus sp.]
MGKITYYASAGTIGVAGIIHLVMVPMAWERFLPIAILFLAAGVAQLFWIIPSIKRWSSYWFYIGIGGNAVLIVLWTITRFPNPVTERALPINEFGIVTQIMQGVYIGLTSYILNIARKERLKTERKVNDDEEKSAKRGSPIQ